MPSIAENLAAVEDRIVAAADRAGRDPADVRLVAVTKTFGPGDVSEAVRAGARLPLTSQDILLTGTMFQQRTALPELMSV